MNHQNPSTIHPKGSACCRADALSSNENGNAETHEPAERLESVLLSIAGMHCGACASRIRDALMKMKGVASAHVVFAGSAAKVRFDPGIVDIAAIISTIASVGYEAGLTSEKPEVNLPRRVFKMGARPFIFGAAAALGILGFYLGLITLTSDWYNAKAQFGDYRWWLLSLAAGLGLQVGLFVHLRAFIARTHIKGATSSVAASGGMSTLSMALCCSHYVAAFLPTVGLPFLSTAVAGLAAYQVQFFMAGVVSNILGIIFMLRLMAKNGIIHAEWIYRPA